jgi:glycine cleavage system regulatory protein
MSRLAGQFAGIVHVEVPSEQVAALRAGLDGLALSVVAVETGPEPGPEAVGTRGRYHLEVLGQDRPGIVRDVAAALAGRGINVVELETECVSAPWTGERLFRARLELEFPEGTSLEQVRADLRGLEGELALDLDLATPPPEADPLP